MTVNLHDSAYAMEMAIRQCDEFLQLKNAYHEVNIDANAKQIFDQFREIQVRLQQKQMMGENILEQDVQQAQALTGLVQQNPKIAGLMQAEQRMNMLIGELNQVILKPLAELYGEL